MSVTAPPTRIVLAEQEAEIRACHPVMAQLRPQFGIEDFVATVRRLGDSTGFRLAYLADADGIQAVAGYRVSDWLAGGRYLEIEDLVTAAGSRSRGHGGQLFDWLVDQARQQGCRHLRLVSNVVRTDAHRFYLRKGMALQAHYFSLALEGGPSR